MASNDPASRINELVPRWDASNPTAYNYDWRNYNRADYQKFKEARAQRDRERQAKAERDLKQTMKDVRDFIKEKLPEDVRANYVPEWDGESECFADLEYDAEAGGVVATFHRGGEYRGPSEPPCQATDYGPNVRPKVRPVKMQETLILSRLTWWAL